LAERLQPDPTRAVELQIQIGDSKLLLEPDSAIKPVVHVGDVLRLQIGPILDLNNRPVPDGTLVNYQLIYEGEPLALNLEPASTRNGATIREVTLERSGTLLIAANVGAASTGKPIALDVQDKVQIDLTPPPGEQTPTIAATATLTTTQSAAPTGEGEATPQPEQPSLLGDDELVNFFTLTIALATMVITLSLLLIAQVQILRREVLVHNMLWAIIFGLSAYILYSLGLIPGIALLKERLGVLGPAVVVFIAMLLPLLWLQLRTEQLQ
jgi:hypothetical protein